MFDISVRIGDLELKSPVIAASGTFGFGEEYAQIYDVSCLGAICTKALTLHLREGNPPPRLWEAPCGLLNSIGLENPGVKAFLSEELPRMRRLGTLVIANVWSETPEGYGELVRRLSDSPVDAVELNLSCPNVPGGEIMGKSAGETAQAVRVARRICEKPLWVKLPPEGDIVGAARAAEREGADAVSAINTFRGLAIDIETGRPVFANIFGGLSGPAIKPLALRIVYELSKAVDIPVIGCGGIVGWEDAVEFIMAGAYAIQVGTANFIDPLCGLKIVEGLRAFMESRGIKSWEEIRGCAH